ncbi:unnamed protein product [Effrenium voratum]|uniref:Fe2OG dioxygenase domain-containing protein n=1 Tax=Effrenium voratum TaxID=2562239 RepID=A0AA36N3B5_9DINO|nr:unnamed protein product [Effrenium voratum]CAJ1452235.1 unnamed protein product [Effrenium voratum]
MHVPMHPGARWKNWKTEMGRFNTCMQLVVAAASTQSEQCLACGVRYLKDVKIRDLTSTAAQKIFQDKLAAPLIEAIGQYFELPKENVTVDDAFIVRYATDSQRGLAFHRDGSIVSSIVTLSNESDYVGGGTEFMDGSVYRPSQGGGILFGGQRLHGGVEIVRGARYICTIFFKCGGLSCRDLAVKKDKEEEGDPGIWGAIANIMGVGQ